MSSTFDGRGKALLALAAVLGLGCQVYDFEPVVPTTIGQSATAVAISARGLKPNLMFVIDRSGSMNLPFEASNPACGTCGQAGQPSCNPASCASRWSTLSDTTASFLSAHETLARTGVAFFPRLVPGEAIDDPVSGTPSQLCDPTSEIDVPLSVGDDDATLKASAQAVSAAIAAVGAALSPAAGGVGGGTPTGSSLLYVSQHALFAQSGRQNFVLLMTDGLPNCSATSGLNGTLDASACDCTEIGVACTTDPSLTCNDSTETAQYIAQLHASGIDTIVVGYGDVFGPSAQGSLQAMAVAGGFQRRCQANGQECAPSDTACLSPSNANLCAEQFFRVSSQAQLAGALASISASIVNGDPCTVTLDPAPQNAAYIAVDVTEKGVLTSYPYPAAIWTYQAAAGGNPALLTFIDPLCSAMKSASEDVTYVVRSVTVL